MSSYTNSAGVGAKQNSTGGYASIWTSQDPVLPCTFHGHHRRVLLDQGACLNRSPRQSMGIAQRMDRSSGGIEESAAIAADAGQLAGFGGVEIAQGSTEIPPTLDARLQHFGHRIRMGRLQPSCLR